MAATLSIKNLTGAGPTLTTVTQVTFNRIDTANGTTPVPIPSVNTVFSWVKSFQISIDAYDGMTISNILFGKRSNEATGLKYWSRTSHAIGAYTQAVTTPAGTAGNNAVAPEIPETGDGTGSALALITAPPAAYAAGPFTLGGSGTGPQGNIVEVCVGVDSTVTGSGAQVVLPNLVWQWTES